MDKKNVELLVPGSSQPIKGEKALKMAAECLLSDGLVCLPTETVYGVAARLTLEAIDALFALKGRDPAKPVAIAISSLEQAAQLAEKLPASFFLLAKAFLPGPLTLVVRKREEVTGRWCSGLSTIGFRFSSDPIAQEVLHRVGEPLALSSANVSGMVELYEAQQVYHAFEGRVAVLDGGKSLLQQVSTVLSLENPQQPVLLREGAISMEQIRQVLG